MEDNESDESLITLAGRLRYALRIRRMSQRRLAETAGCSQQLVSHIVTGDTESSAKLPDIARALNVRHDWLYYGQGDMDPDSERVLDRAVFLDACESTIAAALGGQPPLQPREIARLCLDVYEAAMGQKGGVKFSREQISAVAPVVLRYYNQKDDQK